MKDKLKMILMYIPICIAALIIALLVTLKILPDWED